MATIQGGVAADILTGGAGNDVILGFDGADRIDGRAGNDVLMGGLGADTFVIRAGEGFDAIIDADGTDTLRILGDSFIDLDFAFRDGADLVLVGVIEEFGVLPENGIRILNHFAGSPVLYVELDTTVSNLNYGVDPDLSRFYLAAGNAGQDQGDYAELIVGTELGFDSSGNDVITTGGGYFETVFGLGGDDLITVTGDSRFVALNAGAGDDTVIGGNDVTGRDIFRGGRGTDFFDGGAGTTDRIDYRDGEFSIRVDLAITGYQYISGYEGSDRLLNIEHVYGGRFNDTILGAAANELLLGRDGRDILDGRGGADTMEGGSENDVYYVDSALDVVTEASGTFTGSDLVYASVNHTLAVNVERLILTGAALLGTGNTSANLVNGNALANTLSGLAGNDTINGRAGDDTLSGGDGDDRIGGGGGLDSMTGGLGLDRFDFNDITDTGATVPTADIITDFTNSTVPGAFVDRIDLRDIDAIEATAAEDAFEFIGYGAFVVGGAAGKIRAVINGTETRLFLSTDSNNDVEAVIVLKNFTATLEAIDFLL